MLAITVVSLFLIIVITIGGIVAFEDVLGLHPVCVEAIQILWHEPEARPVFEIPQNMVWWGEASEEVFKVPSDMIFWREEVPVGDVLSLWQAFPGTVDGKVAVDLALAAGADGMNDPWFWTDASA